MMNQVSANSNPKLSVIVASQNARDSAEDSLQSLVNQCDNGKIEIVVVDNSTNGTGETIKKKFLTVKFVAADKEKFIPELWGIGINQSTGEYIALTTTHFVPSADWTTEILKAHEERNCAGIGGAIENERKAGLVSWAIYFCRYSPYMLPFGKAETTDFAADNASYKRRDLEKVEAAMRDGFWETFVHQKMLRAGMILLKSPEIVVYHQKSFTFTGFVSQRFYHGKQFGETRAAQMARRQRAAMFLLSPSIPFIYLFRITRLVFAKKRNLLNFLLSLPILTAFLLSWTVGEANGYLQSLRKK